MAIYPREYIQNQQRGSGRTGNFVLMPFAREMDVVYSSIRRACESPDVALPCQRADDFYRGGHIMEDVLRGIFDSEYIVADVSGKNPNVFYELGIAHSDKPASKVIIITQSLDDVPFDLRHLRCLVYRKDAPGLRQLEHDLVRAFQDDPERIRRFMVVDAGTHDFGERLPGHGRNFYTFRIAEIMVGTTDVKVALVVQRHSLDQGPAEYRARHYMTMGDSITIQQTNHLLRLDVVDENRAYFSVVPKARHRNVQQAGDSTSAFHRDIPHEIHHVSLAVSDLQRSIEFYRDVLGLEQNHDRPGYGFEGAWFTLPSGQDLHLVLNPRSTAHKGRKKERPYLHDHFALRVQSIRAFDERVQDLQLQDKVTKDTTLPTPFPQRYMLDPDGHVVEVNAAIW